MLIPDCVRTKYDIVASGMIDELGIDCTVVYPPVNIETSKSVPLFKQKNTMLQTSDPYGFNIGAENYVTTETTGIVRLRCYWSQRDWRKLSSVDLAEGSCMSIGYLSDLPKLQKADHILIHTEVGHQFKFIKAAEPIVHGLTKKYLMSFWKRNG